MTARDNKEFQPYVQNYILKREHSFNAIAICKRQPETSREPLQRGWWICRGVHLGLKYLAGSFCWYFADPTGDLGPLSLWSLDTLRFLSKALASILTPEFRNQTHKNDILFLKAHMIENETSLTMPPKQRLGNTKIQMSYRLHLCYVIPIRWCKKNIA